MTFLAPGFLIAAGLIAAAVVALHFIVSRDPRTQLLPTARFAPERPVRARAQALRLQDLLLMAMRVLLVLAAGAALARPVLHPPRSVVARIILADRSRSVANIAEVMDSVRGLQSSGSVVVAFDSAAAELPDANGTTTAPLEATTRRGRLSVALIAGLRAAARMRDAVDSLEMVVVSPLDAEEVDEATDSIRALWPGGIRLVAVAPKQSGPVSSSASIDASADDPLRMAIPAPATGNAATVHIVRAAPSAADSAVARSGGTLVYWPREIDATASGGRMVRAAPDTVGAVVAGNAVVVAPFMRSVRLDAVRADSQRIVARWVDGEAAAVETPLGSGCVRTVAVPVPDAGDLVLERRFARFVAVMASACGSSVDHAPLDSVRRAALAGPPSRLRAAASAIRRPDIVPTPLAAWLLGLALALALGELLVRRRIAGPSLAAQR